MKFTGIPTLEYRGSPSIIWNIQSNDFSITHFADFHVDNLELLQKNMSDDEKNLLRSTNIAIFRPSITANDMNQMNYKHMESKILELCDPNIIIPEHYLPKSFLKTKCSIQFQEKYEKTSLVYDEMIEIFQSDFDFSHEKISGYEAVVEEIDGKKIIEFENIHPQCRFVDLI